MVKEKDQTMEIHILECAEKLFLKKGFALTSTTEIAKEAGCNQALVHYYYRTKENLFQKIFEQKFILFISSFLSIESQSDTFLEKLQKRLETHFDLLYANKELPFLLLNEILTNPNRLNSLKDILMTIDKSVYINFDRELNEEIKAGRIRQTTSIDIAMNILSLNISTFLSLPIVKGFGMLPEDEERNFIHYRKKEIITTIINSLKV